MIKCLLAKLKSFLSRLWGFYCQHYILLAVIASIAIFVAVLGLVSCRGLYGVAWNLSQNGNQVTVADTHDDSIDMSGANINITDSDNV